MSICQLDKDGIPILTVSDDGFKAEFKNIIELRTNDTVHISSNNYSREFTTDYYSWWIIGNYPTTPFVCIRTVHIKEGLLRIKFVDSKISPEDVVAIGFGLIPMFHTAIYATLAALKMPIRDNHPKSVYIKPTIFGANMWILFSSANSFNSRSMFQFPSQNTGFRLEISAVQEYGMSIIGLRSTSIIGL